MTLTKAMRRPSTVEQVLRMAGRVAMLENRCPLCRGELVITVTASFMGRSHDFSRDGYAYTDLQVFDDDGMIYCNGTEPDKKTAQPTGDFQNERYSHFRIRFGDYQEALGSMQPTLTPSSLHPLSVPAGPLEHAAGHDAAQPSAHLPGLQTPGSGAGERQFVCGTRAVNQVGPNDWRIVCATCGKGGTVPYRVKDAANHGAVRDSNKPCRICGAL